MPLAPDYYTADMVRAMPDDGKRYEVVWGELLVTPAPVKRHQRVVGRLYAALHAYCARTNVGEAFTSPADISWDSDSLVQPDVFVVAPEHANHEWKDIRHLRLVVEVLSPSTASHDRFQKRKLYQENGVETLWLVDAERGLVETWTPEQMFPVVATERVIWQPAGADDELVVELAELLDTSSGG